jgi:hypothetical protein
VGCTRTPGLHIGQQVAARAQQQEHGPSQLAACVVMRGVLVGSDSRASCGSHAATPPCTWGTLQPDPSPPACAPCCLLLPCAAAGAHAHVCVHGGVRLWHREA